MKLTTNTNVSVDSVMQGLGGPEEDRSGGFERGGWAMPQWADTTVLSGDVAAAVSELKAKPGGELQVVGSLSVVRLLLDALEEK
jgi:hypothetical protein